MALSTVFNGASAICWTLCGVRGRAPRLPIRSRGRDLPSETGALEGLDLGHRILHWHLTGRLQAQKLLKVLLSGHNGCMVLSWSQARLLVVQSRRALSRHASVTRPCPGRHDVVGDQQNHPSPPALNPNPASDLNVLCCWKPLRISILLLQQTSYSLCDVANSSRPGISAIKSQRGPCADRLRLAEAGAASQSKAGEGEIVRRLINCCGEARLVPQYRTCFPRISRLPCPPKAAS